MGEQQDDRAPRKGYTPPKGRPTPRRNGGSDPDEQRERVRNSRRLYWIVGAIAVIAAVAALSIIAEPQEGGLFERQPAPVVWLPLR